MSARQNLCLFCQLKDGLRLQRASKQKQWQPRRGVSQLQKKKPSRMVLTPDVRKSKTPSSGQRQTKYGPFGGMNRVFAGPLLEEEKRRKEERNFENKKSSQTSQFPRKGKRDQRQNEGMKALKMQRALSQVSYGQRSAIKQRIDEINSFEEFPLLPSIQQSIPTQALSGLDNIEPTPIQRLAIPALLGTRDAKGRKVKDGPTAQEMQQFLLAAETGSGKTLAYLLPTLDFIKRQENEQIELREQEEGLRRVEGGNKFELEPPPPTQDSAARPEAIVLVPTAELVEQVGSLFKAFSHTVKYRAAFLSANYSATVIRNRLFGSNGVDVVISTPHLLNSIVESDPNILSQVTNLVIDEADSLLDRSFSSLTTNIIDRASPSLRQLVLCSATIPRNLDGFLLKRYPSVQRLATPNLHAIPRRVQLSVVDIDKQPYQGNRDLACADTIWSIGRTATESSGNEDARLIIVFVNEREKTAELASYLASKGVDAVALNRDTTEERRGEILSSFTSKSPNFVSKDTRILESQVSETSSTADTAKTMSQSDRTLHGTKVIVMTDIGSRGIDTTPVRHVILYDVPHTSIDFIHRLGRTGRMGRRGRGVVLAGRYDRKDIIREVRENMYRGQALI